MDEFGEDRLEELACAVWDKLEDLFPSSAVQCEFSDTAIELYKKMAAELLAEQADAMLKARSDA